MEKAGKAKRLIAWATPNAETSVNGPEIAALKVAKKNFLQRSCPIPHGDWGAFSGSKRSATLKRIDAMT